MSTLALVNKILNDTELCDQFVNSVFLTNRITPVTLAQFQHFVEKYVPTNNVDYLAAATAVVKKLYGSVEVDLNDFPPQPTETSLMNGYDVEKRTYIDGACVDDMRDSEIVDRIAAIETDIAALGKIQVSSTAIQNQIAKMGKTTGLLAGFLDARYADAAKGAEEKT